MSRRAAREAALQVLYKADIAGRDMDVKSELDYWLEELAPDGSERDGAERTAPRLGGGVKGMVVSGDDYDFALDLIRGTLLHCEEFDLRITETAKEWDLNRMDVVDRNLMRLALFEMMFCPGIPHRVSVNEAVELAKTFCSEESAKFVNGILDRFIAAEER